MTTDKDTTPDKPIELDDADVEQVVGGLKASAKPIKRPIVTLNDPDDGGE